MAGTEAQIRSSGMSQKLTPSDECKIALENQWEWVDRVFTYVVVLLRIMRVYRIQSGHCNCVIVCVLQYGWLSPLCIVPTYVPKVKASEVVPKVGEQREVSSSSPFTKMPLTVIILPFLAIERFISLIPRLSHRLEYFTIQTISWSWNSSPTISWLPVRYASVNIIHMFLCVSRKVSRAVL